MLSSWLLYLFLSKFGFGNVITCPSMQMVIRTQKNKNTNKSTKQKKISKNIPYTTQLLKGSFQRSIICPCCLFFLVIDKKKSSSVENLNHIFIWTLSAVVVIYLKTYCTAPIVVGNKLWAPKCPQILASPGSRKHQLVHGSGQ